VPPTHAAFLRAVNLGSTRKAPKEKLVECFEGLGYEDVATFRTSGNVVFSARGSAKQLKAQVERGLEDSLGFEVPVFLRTEKQLAAIAAKKPFPPKALVKSKGKLQVALLDGRPESSALKRVEEMATEADLLAIDGSELYWLPEAGTQESPLDMKAIDKSVGLNTLRTMGTIEQLYGKYFRPAPTGQ
jgi:uncharacterized protein (DUF1697 family)